MQDKKNMARQVEVAEEHGISRRQFLARGAAFTLAAAVTGPGLTVLSGCGGSDSSASGPLEFWQFDAGGGGNSPQAKWYLDVADAWNKDHETQIKMKYIPVQDYISGTKLKTGFASGEGPDIFVASSNDFTLYYNNGALQDLTPFIEDGARDDFYQNVLATRMVDDKIYAVPLEVEPLAMYYSVKAFEDAGLSEADIPETWDQLLEVAGKLKKGDRFGVLFETNANFYQNFTWYPFMWQGGGDTVAKSGKESAFDSKGGVQALQFWQDAIEMGVAPRKALGSGAGDLSANLVQGHCAIEECGIWGVGDMRQNAPDFEYGVFKLPVPPGGTYTTNFGGWAWAVSSKGKNPEEAAKFCVWALGSMSEDSIERGVRWLESDGVMGARKSVVEQATQRGHFDPEPMKFFRDEAFPGSRAENRYPPEISKMVNDAIQNCQLGGADPKQTAEQTAQNIDSFLEGYSGAPLI
ncbi:MAG: sugar ABC transporter substrate-binding protein [Chloroflexota bacterium]|nr:sugar ABC transporter substrate-binding protein [Chloroflexota bacterium]